MRALGPRPQRSDVMEYLGYTVFGADGRKIGSVGRSEADFVEVEFGFFRTRSLAISRDEIARNTGRDLFLRRPAGAYRRDISTAGWSPWRSSARTPEARAHLEELAGADRAGSLGAQSVAGLAHLAKGSCVEEADILESERDDRLAGPATALREPPAPVGSPNP